MSARKRLAQARLAEEEWDMTSDILGRCDSSSGQALVQQASEIDRGIVLLALWRAEPSEHLISPTQI